MKKLNNGKTNNNNRFIRRRRKCLAPPEITIGKYLAEGVKLDEASINNLVLRITLQDCTSKKDATTKQQRTRRLTRNDITGDKMKRLQRNKNVVMMKPPSSQNVNKRIWNFKKKARKVVSTSLLKDYEVGANLTNNRLRNGDQLAAEGSDNKAKLRTYGPDRKKRNASVILTKSKTIEDKIAAAATAMSSSSSSSRMDFGRKCTFDDRKSTGGHVLRDDMSRKLSQIIDQPVMMKLSNNNNIGLFNSNSKYYLSRLVDGGSERVYYFLKFAAITISEESKLNCGFKTLMNSMKNIKLPSKDWKIKIMIRQNNVFSILITNGQVFERSLTFFAQSAFYNIVIDNIAVVLIGCPKSIDTVKDVEVLLDIIHNVRISDPMIKFK